MATAQHARQAASLSDQAALSDQARQCAQQLRRAYASRKAAGRPMSHSLATAYQQLIARYEQHQKKPK